MVISGGIFRPGLQTGGWVTQNPRSQGPGFSAHVCMASTEQKSLVATHTTPDGPSA